MPNKKNITETLKTLWYRPKKVKNEDSCGIGGNRGKMNVFFCLSHICLSKSHSIYDFLNLLFQFYPIIYTFFIFFLKNKTHMRRPTITVCMVGLLTYGIKFFCWCQNPYGFDGPLKIENLLFLTFFKVTKPREFYIKRRIFFSNFF